MRPILLSLVLVGWLGPLASWLAPAGAAAAVAQTPADAYAEARQALLELMEDTKRNQYRDAWHRVIRRLDQAASALPAGDLRCAAWYNGARAHAEMSKVSYLGSDRDEAERRYREMADRCADSYLADDALYRVAEIFLDRDPPRARAALEDLIRRFPAADMAPLAREALATLPPSKPAPTASVAAAKPSASPTAAAKPAAPAAPASTAAKPAAPASSATGKPPLPGSHLPSAADILAAMEEGPAPAERTRLQALGEAVGQEVPLSVVAGLKVKTVVLDPGHGGKDTGAIGPGGVYEKDLTLAMAKRLRGYLEQMGLEVFLTRDKDVTLSLEDRTRFANEKGADLFLSLHVNASHNKKAQGIETYTLNLNSDRYAMRLAARENASSTRKIGDLQLILADLATKANTDDSVQLARWVQGKMVEKLRGRYGADTIRDLGVKQALFFVLVGAKMPAVLLETGFISHPEEVKRLRTGTFQEDAMRGVAEGVRQFILEREAIASGATRQAATAVF